MKTTLAKPVFAVLAAVALCAVAHTPAIAQNRDRGIVAICPVVFRHNTGTKTARKTAVRSMEEVLQRAGYTVVPHHESERTWMRMNLPMASDGVPVRRGDIARFGNAVHARYVVTPTFKFHSRSIWVDLGPRTDSTATVDLSIVDVANHKTVFTRQGVSARSDEKFDVVKAGADVLFTPLVTIVSGGPKTPHEQRAVQIAVVRAMRPWIRPNDRGDDYDH